MATKIELRRRVNGTFNPEQDDPNSNLLLPVTHVDFVLGLLDSNKKLNISLFNDSVLNTKRMGGNIQGSVSLADVYQMVKNFNDDGEISYPSLYPGTYFISNGQTEILPSEGHVLYYNDDNDLPGGAMLEHNDSLFYLKFGTVLVWNPSTKPSTQPNIYLTETELVNNPPVQANLNAVIPGFHLIEIPSLPEYDIELTIDTPGMTKEAIVGLLYDTDAWNEFTNKTLLVQDSYGAGQSYQIEYVGEHRYFKSEEEKDKHIWSVINNTYDLATESKAGLMSASDKRKLNTLSNYNHPIYDSREVTTEGVTVIGGITVNSEGHVTSVTTRTLPPATDLTSGVMSPNDKAKLDSLENYSHPTQASISRSGTGIRFIKNIEVNELGHVTSATLGTIQDAATDKKGIVELATKQEAILATDSDRALTPSTGLALVNYHQAVHHFGSFTEANTSNIADGSIAIIEQGTVTV